MPSCEVLVHGAGSIGLYVGGRLAAAGLRVHFVGRARVVEGLRERGLRLVDLDGGTVHLKPGAFSASESLAGAPLPALALLTVKGPATTTAAKELGEALPAETPVLSFQNGVANRERLAAAAPSLQAIAGMVPFNVVQPEPGAVRRATEGELACADTAVTRSWAPRFEAAGLPLHLHADMAPVLWGKLLLNLNNPVNAMAGLPLVEELGRRDYRRVLAALQDEALAALGAAKLRPARLTALPPAWLPGLLRLPDWVFRALARRMLAIAPDARSSMQDDRVAGRPTEIDDLCGAVVVLGRAHGVPTPANQRMLDLVRDTPPGVFMAAEVLLGRVLGGRAVGA